MKLFSKQLIFSVVLNLSTVGFCANQTPTLSPVLIDQQLPFGISIEVDDFILPEGLHSGAFAAYKGKWLYISGRTNGMHTFEPNNNNFPPSSQNTSVFVIDPIKKTVVSRSLLDAESGLSQNEIDILSTTSPLYYQNGKTLYIVGGYGVESNSGEFTTKDTLTAVDIPGLINWVTKPTMLKNATKYFRTIHDPLLRLTGGNMFKSAQNLYLLVFGQDFEGFYLQNSTGIYTEQVRRCFIHDNGKLLAVRFINPSPLQPDPSFRRRDLNVVPIIKGHHGRTYGALVALAGVFTETEGVWTVPVEIDLAGHCTMADPEDPKTFKQPMNHYDCANAGLYSRESGDMYTLLFGGISFGYIVNGVYVTDPLNAFINQVTAVRINRRGVYSQYLIGEFPVILSTQSNPGNQLLFGSNANFVSANLLSEYKNGVFKLDKLKKRVLLGYIIGGIESTLPDTNVASDSAASPYIFKVFAYPTESSRSSSP